MISNQTNFKHSVANVNDTKMQIAQGADSLGYLLMVSVSCLFLGVAPFVVC